MQSFVGLRKLSYGNEKKIGEMKLLLLVYRLNKMSSEKRNKTYALNESNITASFTESKFNDSLFSFSLE